MCGAAEAFSGSGFSTIVASVVKSSDATDAAFSSATRETFVGSMTPDSNKSSYFSVYALNPNAPLPSLILVNYCDLTDHQEYFVTPLIDHPQRWYRRNPLQSLLVFD